MPSPPRSRKIGRALRKAVKWGGLVVTVLLVVVWIGSGWGSAALSFAGMSYVAVEAGRLSIQSQLREAQPGESAILVLNPRALRFELWFDGGPWGAGYVLFIPLWFPALLSLLATAAAWRADSQHLRRARAGMCPACGYDRAGLAAVSVCPECGAAASVQNHPAGA